MKLEPHQRKGMIAAGLLALAALVALLLSGCSTTATPLCRHVVLSHYAAFVDAGYETEICHMKNKKDGKWLWVEQPKLVYTTTTQAPINTIMLRKMEFSEVAGWVKGNEND